MQGVVVERIDAAEWPATVSVGPGWYGLRIDTDHGPELHYVAMEGHRATQADVEAMRDLLDALNAPGNG